MTPAPCRRFFVYTNSRPETVAARHPRDRAGERSETRATRPPKLRREKAKGRPELFRGDISLQLNLRPQLDDAVRRDLEELRGLRGVLRHRDEELLAPQRHPGRHGGDQRLA